MARKGNADLAGLEAQIGYSFRDTSLAERALTHVSAIQGRAPARTKSYQRLEFLGDRVLGVVIADMLFAEFPSAAEGELSQRLAELVRKESCADVARGWNIGTYVRLGDSEANSGGADKTPILGDVCEAIIGAVYLDGGYDAARKLIEENWRARMQQPRRPLRDPKTALQEWAQGRGLPAPTYSEENRSGPAHAPQFVIAVHVEGFAPASAKGTSKRAGEQAAARAFAEREKLRGIAEAEDA